MIKLADAVNVEGRPGEIRTEYQKIWMNRNRTRLKCKVMHAELIIKSSPVCWRLISWKLFVAVGCDSQSPNE